MLLERVKKKGGGFFRGGPISLEGVFFSPHTTKRYTIEVFSPKEYYNWLRGGEFINFPVAIEKNSVNMATTSEANLRDTIILTRMMEGIPVWYVTPTPDEVFPSLYFAKNVVKIVPEGIHKIDPIKLLRLLRAQGEDITEYIQLLGESLLSLSTEELPYLRQYFTELVEGVIHYLLNNEEHLSSYSVHMKKIMQNSNYAKEIGIDVFDNMQKEIEYEIKREIYKHLKAVDQAGINKISEGHTLNLGHIFNPNDIVIIDSKLALYFLSVYPILDKYSKSILKMKHQYINLITKTWDTRWDGFLNSLDIAFTSLSKENMEHLIHYGYIPIVVDEVISEVNTEKEIVVNDILHNKKDKAIIKIVNIEIYEGEKINYLD